jgi:DNA polymerase-1
LKTFYLIDGHAQIFRAYYAPFPPLTSPDGEPTKATYVFTQMILNILRDKKPDFLAVTLDHGDETTERKAFYEDYKANRDASPEDLGPQIDRIVEILEAFRVPIYKIKGQEADDIIATIARRMAGEDVEIFIVSRDKDLYQVLSDRVKLWDPTKDKTIDPVSLERDLGFTPEQSIEIQTLTGDSTDNIPGVPGIGPKKAAGLIQKYGNVDEVLAHLEELTPKMRENLDTHRETLDLSRRLVTLNTEVEVDFKLDDCVVDRFERESLRPLFEDLGFRRLMGHLETSDDGADGDGASEAPVLNAPRGTCHLVNTPEQFDEFFALLEKQKRFAIDTETTSLRPVDCDLIGLCFSWQEGEGWYVALASNTGTVLDRESSLERLRPILEDDAIGKIGQNIKYDVVVLRSAGIDLGGVIFDTMVASYLLQPDRRGHGMDALARDFLSYETIPISDLIGKGKSQISMLDVELEKLAQYAAEDGDITWRLYEQFAPRIEASPVKKLFEDVEMSLVGVLAEMEYAGVKIDSDRLRETSKQLGVRVEELLTEIYGVVGHEFNLDSPKQLSEVLFDEIGLRVVKKTKTSRSTDASVLQTLALETEHPLPKLILEYRELTKLRGTYLEPLPGFVSPKTGRLHASFHQAVAATGRLSSSDPNLQNIPIRTEQGREIRRAFIAGDSDHVILTADYSQIELRILTHLCKDPGLMEAFATDQDIHTFVASQIFDVAPDDVTRDMRSRAKAVNFGIIYGQGAFGLSRTLGIPRKAAADFIGDYQTRYPGITKFMEDCVLQAESEGEVATMLGRRRPIPEVKSRNRNTRALGERLAINTVVQGSAADLIKVAMINIARRIDTEELDLRLIIQVHDELVFEAPRNQVEELAEIVRHEMVNALPMDVPVKVDVSWGDNWLEGK